MAEALTITKSTSARGPFRTFIRRLGQELWRNKLGLVGGIVVVLFVAVGLLAPVLSPYDPYETNLRMRLAGPSAEHWLGNDQLGRDLLSRVIHGARVSLLFGIVTTLIAGGVGLILGLISGYFGGIVDSIIMRGIDLLLAFPGILLAIAVVAILGPGIGNAMIAIGVDSIPIFARTIRSRVLSLRERDFVQSSTALGATHFRIVGQHILPNTLSPLIVLAALRVGTAILAASTLSFLGLGVQQPTPEWGAIMAAGRDSIRNAPHLTVYPGIALSIVVISFAAFGSVLRDSLDPKLANRR